MTSEIFTELTTKSLPYDKIHHTKFTKNQHVDIYRDNDILTVCCKQENSTPGIRINSVTFPSGEYIINMNLEYNDEQLILWIQQNKSKIENRICLSNNNNIEISFNSDVSVNIGILFVAPRKDSKFILKNFVIKKKEIQREIEINTTNDNINNLIDHAYVINLDSRPDRLFRVNRYLKKIGIPYERIPGVVPKQSEFENIQSDGSQITTIGALGCIMSHINVLRNAIKNQYKTILIMEDDIVPIKSFDLNKIKVPIDWDILYLGCSQYNYSSQKLQHNDSYYVAKRSRGTFAYVIKNHMFNILLGLFSVLGKNVDMYLEEIQEKYKCYVSYENLMIADLTDSDISNSRDIDEYGNIFGWNNRKYYAHVSIILPVFNGQNYLQECLESIKKQTFTDYELIIINDGSSDSTNEILHEFFINNPFLTVTYIEHGTNMGLPKSLNDGLKCAHGEYITWISHDNKFKQNALQLMSSFLDHNKIYNLVTAGHENFTDQKTISESIPFSDNVKEQSQIITNKVFGMEYNNETILTQFHGVASFMYRRDIIKKIGYYDEDLFGVEDYDYLIRILELQPHKSGTIVDILCEFRRHSEQLTHKLKNKYPSLKQKMMEKRANRICNNELNITVRIQELIDNSKDTFIYPPIVKYDLLFQRPQQIMKCMTKYFNCIFITKDENYKKINDNVIILSLNKFLEMKDKIVKNKVILYYTDPRAINYTKKTNDSKNINPDIVIFDLIDNPVEEFSCWKENLSDALFGADIITYSAKYLETVINDFQENNKKFKNIPIYLTNCCDKEILEKLIEVRASLERNINDITTKKKIVGYYGAISTWLDYDLIKTIADNDKIHVVMIGLLKNNTKYNMKFEHKNITWLEHKNYNDLPKYLNCFDICMIPFIESEMMNGCNPIKLYEFLCSGKPVISTINFQDFNETDGGYYIVNKLTANNVINRILFSSHSTFQQIPFDINVEKIPYWDSISSKLYQAVIDIKRQLLIPHKKCAYVTNMLVDWKTLIPRFGGGEKYALSIARLLSENNIDVHFYQMAETTCNTSYYSFPVHCISMNGLETYQEFCIGYSEKVNEIIANEKYDYVIYGMPEMCCSDNIISNAVSINHGIWFDRNTIIKDPKWYKCMETHVKIPCINVSVDTNFINFIRAINPEYGKKLNYIPNFYSPSEFIFTEKHNEKITIVIPRRASIYRGSRIMSNILTLVNHDVNFIWVGKGDTDDNKILEDLENVDKRFKFTGCSFEEMKIYYAIADIVVIPTIASEGTSLSCIEAMASGCAVVSTNIGGLCNLVIDKYNGMLVNPDAMEIANAINTLIEHSDLRKKLVNNAKQTVELFKEENWKQKWMNIFMKIGWIYKDPEMLSHELIHTKNNFIKISRNEVNENFGIYWKNYVHYYELHQVIKNMDDAYKHFLSNTKCQELYICNPSIKVAIFTRNSINGGVESIIAEEAKYMNMDIYITNGITDKMNPFLYEIVKDIDSVLSVVKRYDIVVYHWLPEFAVQAIKLSKKPAIEYLHRRDTDNNDKNVPYDIVTHSPFLMNHCYAKYNKHCQLLEHPINTMKFHPRKSSDNYIGCFCTYSSIKGIDILIKALHDVKFKVIASEWEKYNIVFFGKDQQNYKEYLQQMAKDLGVNCEFRNSVNTWEHINKYKLFIIPSRLEGLPVVLLEALSCNIPIIASDLEGTKEFYEIAKSRNYDKLFQMFKSEDVNDLSQKIYEWFQYPFTEERGYEYIKKYYSSVVHCNKFSNIMSRYVNNYQTNNKKIICSEISQFEKCIINSENNDCKIIDTVNNVSNNIEIDFNKFLRIIIKIDKSAAKFKRIEVIVDVNNIISPIPIGYQYDMINDTSTSYSSDTITISNNGIKSICSPELDLFDTKILRINLRPNLGKVVINDLHVIAYY